MCGTHNWIKHVTHPFKVLQFKRHTHPATHPTQESLDVIAATVGAALSAAVPPGVTRTVYLCDDGKDPKKAAFIATMGAAARWVRFRCPPIYLRPQRAWAAAAVFTARS